MVDDLAICGYVVKRPESLTRGITSEEEFRLLFDASFASVVRTVYRITGDRAVAGRTDDYCTAIIDTIG